MSMSPRIILALAGWLLAAAPGVLLAQSAAPTYTIEQVVVANFPVAMVFAPDGRLFYTEKSTGNVRVVRADGTSQIEPVIHLDTDALSERGLLGIALDPDYADNGFIWVVHTAPGTARDWPTNRIVRFHEADGVGANPQIMLDVPITTGEIKHNGGNLHFDSEGLLYVSFGDYGLAANSQDLDTIPGKIHRFEVTEAGLAPAQDNPFPGSSIYAYGLRNPFDFTFDPVSGAVFSGENGFNCDDEINLVLPGMNYGWGPDYGEQCFGLEPVPVDDYMPPLLSFNPTVAPTGILFYDHPAMTEWRGDLFFCEWNTAQMQRAMLNDTRTGIQSVEAVDLRGAACRLDVVTGPHGSLYFGDLGAIYRLRPAAS